MAADGDFDFWKWLASGVTGLIAIVVGILVKRSYDRVDTDVRGVSEAVRSAFKEFKTEIHKDISDFKKEMTAEMRELARENKNNAQQIVAVTERLGATVERVANWEDKLESTERRWEEKFEEYRKEVHDRIDNAFNKGVEFGRESVRSKRERLLMTGLEAVTESTEDSDEKKEE